MLAVCRIFCIQKLLRDTEGTAKSRLDEDYLSSTLDFSSIFHYFKLTNGRRRPTTPG